MAIADCNALDCSVIGAGPVRKMAFADCNALDCSAIGAGPVREGWLLLIAMH